MAAWEFSNGHEAGRTCMTAINPDFSATAACITVIALSATSPERRKGTQ